MPKKPSIRNKELREKLDGLRDLSDFCQEWTVLRETVCTDGEPVKDLSPDGVETLRWIIKLTDRACLSDEF